MSARELDLAFAPALALRVTYLGELGYELHVPVEYALASLRAAVGRRRAARHRERRLPRDQQPAPREALPRLGIGHHARLQSVRGGTRLLRRARQGRVPRARRAGGGQGQGTAAAAHVVHGAAGGQPLRRRDRAGRRPRARARHQRRLRVHGGPQHPLRVRRRRRAGPSRVRGGSDGRAASGAPAHAAALRSRTRPILA